MAIEIVVLPIKNQRVPLKIKIRLDHRSSTHHAMPHPHDPTTPRRAFPPWSLRLCHLMATGTAGNSMGKNPLRRWIFHVSWHGFHDTKEATHGHGKSGKMMSNDARQHRMLGPSFPSVQSPIGGGSVTMASYRHTFPVGMPFPLGNYTPAIMALRIPLSMEILTGGWLSSLLQVSIFHAEVSGRSRLSDPDAKYSSKSSALWAAIQS